MQLAMAVLADYSGSVAFVALLKHRVRDGPRSPEMTRDDPRLGAAQVCVSPRADGDRAAHPDRRRGGGEGGREGERWGGWGEMG